MASAVQPNAETEGSGVLEDVHGNREVFDREAERVDKEMRAPSMRQSGRAEPGSKSNVSKQRSQLLYARALVVSPAGPAAAVET